MMNLFVTTAITFVLGYILPNVTVTSVWSALWFAIWLGVFNATIGNLFKFAGCALNLLTLGLFNLLINAAMITLADSIIEGIHIEGYLTALLMAIILSLFTSHFGREEEERKRRTNPRP